MRKKLYNTQINIRLSSDEKERFERLAKLKNIGLSELLRKIGVTECWTNGILEKRNVETKENSQKMIKKGYLKVDG